MTGLLDADDSDPSIRWQEYLRERHLFRRLSDGENRKYLYFLHPNRWHYDVLRALDYFRSASTLTGQAPDPRLAEAIDHHLERTLEAVARRHDKCFYCETSTVSVDTIRSSVFRPASPETPGRFPTVG